MPPFCFCKLYFFFTLDLVSIKFKNVILRMSFNKCHCVQLWLCSLSTQELSCKALSIVVITWSLCFMTLWPNSQPCHRGIYCRFTQAYGAIRFYVKTFSSPIQSFCIYQLFLYADKFYRTIILHSTSIIFDDVL